MSPTNVSVIGREGARTFLVNYINQFGLDIPHADGSSTEKVLDAGTFVRKLYIGMTRTT